MSWGDLKKYDIIIVLQNNYRFDKDYCCPYRTIRQGEVSFSGEWSGVVIITVR